MLETSEVAVRLAAATLIGGAIGLNRDLRHKSAGVRTVGLVALVSAAVTVGAVEAAGVDSAMRVLQGLLTGIGFLGAGVIVRGEKGQKVHGLTTAAAVWSATGLGALCALGLWAPTIIAVLLVFVLLVLGGRLEKWVHKMLGDGGDDT